MKNLPRARHSEIVTQQLKDELLVYDLKFDKALCLNKTAMRVYFACNGKTSVEALKHKHRIAEEMILLALEQLKEMNLLDPTEELESPLKGMNRRNMLHKIGVSSVAVFPIISVVSAPKAVRAASCIAAGSPAPPVGNTPTSPSTQPEATSCSNHCTATNQSNSACCTGQSFWSGASYDPGTSTCTCVNYRC
ncbi:MAG: hypothetical protein ACK5NT_11865 [Pyrinomonadaceae bacterium]